MPVLPPSTPSTAWFFLQRKPLTLVVSVVFREADVVESPPLVEMAVDKNRDAIPKFLSQDNSDATSAGDPFVFWLNDDHDGYSTASGETDVQDDLESGSPDYQDGQIVCRRDLEDFQRLWIKVDQDLLEGDEVVLKWVDVTEGAPAIKIYPAAESDGGTAYLTDESVKQVYFGLNNTNPSGYYGKSMVTVSGSTEVAIPFSSGTVWKKDEAQYFLFEASGNGKGTLQVSVRRGSVIAQDAQSTAYKAFMDLKDIKELYERWTVGDGNGGAPTSLAAISQARLAAGTDGLKYISGDPGLSVPTDPNGNKYILFVHGWNLPPWERDAFAETMFKRLYWQGYKGKFGAFQWPTTYNNYNDYQSILTYDDGEYTAWRSAVPLSGLLSSLHGTYGDGIHVLAHSMGNVVTGEALRIAAQAGTGQLVNTYVASQAAVPGHCYDPALTEMTY